MNLLGQTVWAGSDSRASSTGGTKRVYGPPGTVIGAWLLLGCRWRLGFGAAGEGGSN